MQPIPRDSNDNGVVTMLVYHNKPTLLLTVHQHGGDDVTCIRSINFGLRTLCFKGCHKTKKQTKENPFFKRIVRAITNAPYRAHSEVFFK